MDTSISSYWHAANSQFEDIIVVQLQSTAKSNDEGPGIARRIYRTLRVQILEGVYGLGDRLPSTRALAIELGVSRTTITAAYEQLLSEGYIESRKGARARVVFNSRPITKRSKMPSATISSGRLSRYGNRVCSLDLPALSLPNQLVADFRYGNLSGEDFPTLMWKRALNTALQHRPKNLTYSDPRGSVELRAALQGYLWRARSLRCGIDQIIVVNGSQQGLDLCTRLLIDPGNQIVIENPCYAIARQIFLATGATIFPIEVDDEGLKTDQLPSNGSSRLAYVTPSHQFPLGSVLSVARRQDLIAWAQQSKAFVIEDDYDGEYRYDVRPIPPLQTYSNGESVIYLGTVSKTLSPTLRLGYMVVPPALQKVFAAAKQITDRHASLLEQQALSNLISSGSYERHVRKVRRRNAERRETLLKALNSEFSKRVTIVGSDAGLHVIVWFNDIAKNCEAKLISITKDFGAGIYPISPLYADCDVDYRLDRAGIVMGYASLNEKDIERGVQCLASAVEVLT